MTDWEKRKAELNKGISFSNGKSSDAAWEERKIQLNGGGNQAKAANDARLRAADQEARRLIADAEERIASQPVMAQGQATAPVATPQPVIAQQPVVRAPVQQPLPGMPEWFAQQQPEQKKPQFNADQYAARIAMGEDVQKQAGIDISGRVEKQQNLEKVWNSLNETQRDQFRKGLKVNGLDKMLHDTGTDMSSLKKYAERADDAAATQKYIRDAQAEYDAAPVADKQLIDNLARVHAKGPGMIYNEQGQLVDDPNNVPFATIEAWKKTLKDKGYSDAVIEQRIAAESGRLNDSDAAWLQRQVDSGAGNAALWNAASVPISAAGNMVAAADLAAQSAQRAITGSHAPVNANSRMQSASLGMEAVRGETAQNITEGTQQAINSWAEKMPENSAGRKALQDHAEEVGNFLSFMYQTGMSGADSLAAAGIGPAGAIVLGTGAGVANMRDALNNGATLKEAATYGVTTAIFESLFEELSIGQLKSFKKLEELKPATWRDFGKKILGSIATNAFEEANTQIADDLADYFINMDKSQLWETWNNAYEEAKASGMNDEEAKQAASQAAAKWFRQDATIAGIGGAIMGAGFGAAGTFEAAGNIKTSKNIDKALKGFESSAVAGEKYKPESLGETVDLLQNKAEVAKRAGMDPEAAQQMGNAEFLMHLYDHYAEKAKQNAPAEEKKAPAAEQKREPLAGMPEWFTQTNTADDLIVEETPAAEPEPKAVEAKADLVKMVLESRVDLDVRDVAAIAGSAENKAALAAAIGVDAAELQTEEDIAAKIDEYRDLVDFGNSFAEPGEAKYLDGKAKELIADMAAKQGRNVQYAKLGEDETGNMILGKYDPKTKTVYLNENATEGQAALYVALHEFTHSAESAETYRQLVDHIKGSTVFKNELASMGFKGENAFDDYCAFLVENGAADSLEEAPSEAIAYFIGSKDADGNYRIREEFIRELAGEKPSLARRVLNWIRDVLKNLKDGGQTAELRQMEKLLAQALNESQGENQAGTGESKNMFAGLRAKTANQSRLADATLMLQNGTDAETVRKETGWFKGADGKWRFEIDDSKSVWRKNGDAKMMHNQEYLRYVSLYDKILYGSLSKEELAELKELDGKYKHDINNPAANTVGEFLVHDQLYEAYPWLKDMKLSTYYSESSTDGGFYSPVEKAIYINTAKCKTAEEARKTALHEIQHAVQAYEGFAGGSNVEYWSGINARRNAANEAYYEDKAEYNKQYAKLNELREKHKVEEYEDSLVERVVGGELDWEDVSRLIDEYENGIPEIAKVKKLVDSLYKEIKKIAPKKRDAFELYMNTAGEIEARDVQARMDMDEGSRRLEKPNTGDENTVFAEDGVDAYSLGNIVGDSGKSYGFGVILDSTLLDGLNEADRQSMVKARIVELGGKSFAAVDQNGNQILINIAKKNEKFRNKNGKVVYVNNDITTKNRKSNIKQKTVVLADELIQAAKNPKTSKNTHNHGWLDNFGKNNWSQWTTHIQEKNKTVWEATLHVAKSTNGDYYLYDIWPIKKVEAPVKSSTTTTGNSLPQPAANSNTSGTNSNNISGPNAKDISAAIAERKKMLSEKFDPEETKSVNDGAKEYFGHTYNWKEAGYLTPDGKRLDFSGKKYGARGGSRTMDHREIADLYDDLGIDYDSNTDAMIDFMQRGNIRISSESNGINLVVQPTKEQEAELSRYILDRFGKMVLSIDNEYGDTIVEAEYNKGTSAKKILQDIRDYFENGVEPTGGSELGRFRYAKDINEAIKQRQAEQRQKINEQQDAIVQRAERQRRKEKAAVNDTLPDKLRKTEAKLTKAEARAKDYVQQNSNLRKQVQVLKKEFELTFGHKITLDTAGTIAEDILKETGSKGINRTQLATKIVNAFAEVNELEKPDFNRVMGKVVAIMEDVLHNAETTVQATRKTDDAAKAFWADTNTLNVTEKEYASIVAQYGKPGPGGRLMYSDQYGNTASVVLKRSQDGRGLYDYYSEHLAGDNGDTNSAWITGQQNTANGALDEILEARASMNQESTYNQYEEAGDIPAEAARLAQMVADRYMGAPSVLNPTSQQTALNSLRNSWRSLMTELDRQTARAESADQRVQNARDAGKRALERHKTTEERNRVWKNIKKNADWFKAVIEHPTETKHVPAELKDLSRDARALYELCLYSEVDTIPTPDEIKNSTDRLIADVNRLVMAEKRGEEDAMGADWKQSNLMAMIQELQNSMVEFDGKGTYLSTGRLNLQQTRLLNNILAAMKHNALNANKMIGRAKAITVHESASKVINEIRRSKGLGKFKAIEYWRQELMTPKTFFNYISGWAEGETNTLREELNNGQRRSLQIQMEVAQMFDNLTEGDKNQKRLAEFTGRTKSTSKDTAWVDIGLVDENGKVVEIPHSMLCSIWMHLQNQQNVNHMEHTGLTLPNMELYTKKGESAEAWADSVKCFIQHDGEYDFKGRIEAAMSEYDKAWCKQAQKFFDDYSKKIINETSLQLNGYEKAMNKNYFPIRGDKNLQERKFDEVVRDGSIEGSPNMKERNARATSPMLLEDITQVITRQSDFVSKYGGMAIPLRNFSKVWSSKPDGWRDSFHNALAHKYGAWGVQYINQLMGDLNGSTKTEPMFTGNMLSKLRGNYAQAVLNMNPVSALSQVSLASAGTVLDGMAVAKAHGDLFSFAKPGGRKKLDAVNKEIAQHSPMMWARKKGSTQELYDIKNNPGWSTKLLENTPVVKQLKVTQWISRMDENTIAAVWQASKYTAEQRGVKPGSDKYWETVSDLFNRAVEETQPNYTTMQMTRAARSKNELMRAFTMFKSPFMSTANSYMDAIGRLQNSKDKSAAMQKAAKKAVVNAGKAMLFQAAISALLRVAAKGLIYHKFDDDRDETGEVTMGAIAEAIAWQAGSNVASQIDPVFGGMLFERIQKFIDKDTYVSGYGDNSLGLINDMVTDIDNSARKIKEAMDPASDTNMEDVLKQCQKDLYDAALAAGMPASGAKNWANGIMNILQGIAAGTKEEAFGDALNAYLNQGYKFTARNVTAAADKAMDSKRYSLENAQKVVDAYFATATAADPSTSLKTALKKKYSDRYVNAGDAEKEKMEEVLLGIKGPDGQPIYDKDELYKKWVKPVEDEKKAAEREVNQKVTYEAISGALGHGVTEAEVKDNLDKISTYVSSVMAGQIKKDDENTAAWIRNVYKDAGSINKALRLYADVVTAKQLTKDAKGTDTNNDGKTDPGSVKKAKEDILRRAGYSAKDIEKLYKYIK